jgi:hypothetical protein
VRRDSGAPFLQVLAAEGVSILPVAVSLTHTEEWALALVVRRGGTASRGPSQPWRGSWWEPSGSWPEPSRFRLFPFRAHPGADAPVIEPATAWQWRPLSGCVQMGFRICLPGKCVSGRPLNRAATGSSERLGLIAERGQQASTKYDSAVIFPV